MNGLKNEFFVKYSNNVCYDCNKTILVDEKIEDKETGQIYPNLSKLHSLASSILKYNSIVVNCPFSEYGCKWKDKLDFLENHKDDCEYNIIFCENCKLSFMKMDSNDGNCPLCIP